MAKTELPMTAPDGCTYWVDGHLCDRSNDHCDQCMCRCGHRWTREQTNPPQDGHLCGLLWRDEHNPNGSDHKCGEPKHGPLDNHVCACGITRPGDWFPR